MSLQTLPNLSSSDEPAQFDANDAASAPAPQMASFQNANDDLGSRVYGSFWIGKTEFGLPVSVIQEVVNEPEKYAPVPLSPPHILGLFSLRKMIVPVVDLRILLGMPEQPDAHDRKIAIIENGTLSIGLVFDDTGSVINSTGIPRVMFQPSDEGVQDVVVEGVLKMDDGARMVQLLDPLRILGIEKLPRVTKSGIHETESHLGERSNCITFQLGHTNCAIDLRFVQEITEVPAVQKSQVAHGHTLGNIELRGVTMPIVDFRGLVGEEAPFAFNPDALRNRKLVILKLESGYVGLVVYSIDGIIAFYESDVLPFANVALPRHDLVAGCLVNSEEEIVILLDHEKLMQDKILVDAAQSCREIYPSTAEIEDLTVKAEATGTRSTYIVFSLDIVLALDISFVSEIINRPSKLLEPPYALKFVDGILNLRGELVTLINPRVLYSMPERKVADSKVLIFQMGEKKYGMVVDSVNEIVTTQSSALLDLPTISQNEEARIVSQDVIGCLQCPSRDPTMDPIMVLDVSSLISRCTKAESA